MKLFFSILILLTSSFQLTLGQVGFLGKTNFVEINNQVNVPILGGLWRNTFYKESNSKMNLGKDFIDYGFSLSLGKITKNQQTLALTVSLQNTNLLTKEYFASTLKIDDAVFFDTVRMRIESPRFKVYQFGFRLEQKSKKHYAGVGFSYNIGFGFSLSNIQNATYAYSLNEAYPDENYWTEVDYLSIDYHWKPIVGVFVQTGFKIKYPLTKRILINGGFQYNFNYCLKPSNFEQNYVNDDFFIQEDLFFQLQRKNLFQISLSTGLSYLF